MVHKIFDRKIVKETRDKIAPNYNNYDFILQAILDNFSERFEETINKYQLVLDLGCGIGNLSKLKNLKNKAERIIQMDLSSKMIENARLTNPHVIVADEELIPFKKQIFDLVISNLTLHMVNDLPGCLLQIQHILKKGGMLLGSLFGENNLHEFKYAMNKAEIELGLPVRIHTFPLIDMKVMGALLQRTGFVLPVVDKIEVTAHYEDIYSLIKDLEGMGMLNILNTEFNVSEISEELLEKANEIYKKEFSNQDGSINASFEILIITGINM